MTDIKKGPRVSVIMPVYNAGRFLKPAIESILSQTFTDFELIAIDDGSTDDSGRILDEYKDLDDRLVVIHQNNQGVVATANQAMKLARGDYLARQDSDDVSFTRRLEQQVAVLDAHPKVVLATGCFEVFDEDDEYLYREILPAADDDIKRAMYLRNPIGHGSMMLRKSAFEEAGPYDKNGNTQGLGEDFDLFLRLSPLGSFEGLESATYKWRINTTGLTHTKNHHMERVTKTLIDNLWEMSPPRVIGSKELRTKGSYYYHTYKKRGIAMKNMMLADNAQLAIKMIKRRQFFRGCRQLLTVALVGRSGLRAVFYRIYSIQKGTSSALRRRASVGRQDVKPGELGL